MILTRYFTIVIIIFEYSYALSEHDKLTRINKYINEQYLANPIVKIISKLTEKRKNGCSFYFLSLILKK